MTPETGNDRTPSRTRLSALILLRWLAAGGQAATIWVVHLAVAPLDLLPALSTVACSVLLNLGLTVLPGPARGLDENSAARHLAFDIVQLAVLIGLTGGLGNPFCLFLLAPVAVAAALLPRRHVTWLTALAMAAVLVIGCWHGPLPWPEAGFHMPPLYRLGAAVALLVGVVSVSYFTWRIAEEGRRMAAAYAESHLALAQERRAAEIGALAAAVAHEVNTPLATVCLLAQEIDAQLEGEDPLKPDMALLMAQAARCRDTLARLTHQRDRDRAVEAERVPFPALVEMAAAPHAEGAPARIAFRQLPTTLPPPWVERSPEILHGLGNFIQNALQFARAQVEVATWWDESGMGVRIVDDGPGFPLHVLDRLGEPYLSARSASDGPHLGLGVFIAMTLLARTGARITFDNDAERGADVAVEWGKRNDGHFAAGR